MAKSTEAKLRASAKYNANNTTSYNMKLNNKTDADIIERLAEKGVQGYIKRLIREDIEREKGEG